MQSFLMATAMVCGQADGTSVLKVAETADALTIRTDALEATIRKKGYVSGIAAGGLLDLRTGARDVGFGLHILDFLLGHGWRDDGYLRDKKYHGDLPKHYVDGPQICTQAKKVQPRVVRGKDFVGVEMSFRFSQPGKGYKTGSTWTQTLVFQPGKRYVLCGDRIVSANDHEGLLWRIDMPGHVRHKQGDTFSDVFLSYKGMVPAKVFTKDFAPDDRFLYQRKEGKVPERFIRAYRVRQEAKPGPWLAGMTLDPGAVAEAWCHQRGYICFIEELHGRPVKAGEAVNVAYIVGWFDDVADMERTYDRYRGKTTLMLGEKEFTLR